VDDTIKLTIYRILQEQLNNIVRHADAKNVMVEMFQEDNKVYLFIADDGKGFDLQTVKKGPGAHEHKKPCRVTGRISRDHYKSRTRLQISYSNSY
jgi:signal transduction histidine kinase